MPLQRLQSIDLVEDSEPEREALRETIKSTKRSAKRPVSKTVIKFNGVIDISSSDEAPPRSAPTVVIDLSDSSSYRASSSRNNATDDTNDPFIPSTIQSEPPGNSSQVPNKFSHFSYAAPLSRRTSTNLQKVEPAKPTSVQPKRRQTKKPTHRFADEFSDTQLSKITKCIACKLKWTTTKTAAEKMSHVLSCAAKHSFVDETIRALIREELRLNAAAEQQSTAESETYFEDVVKTIAPKKRGRRQKATETIQEVDKESRKRILAKAQSIIGSTTSRIAGESPDKEECHDHLTQNFGQSSLGERYRGATLAFSTGLSQPLASTSSGSGGESEFEFPPTQALGPSRFAQRAGGSSLVQASTGEVLGESNHSFASNILQDVRDLSPPSSLISLPSPSPPVQEHPALNFEQDGDIEINDEADDCFLYYEPGSAGALAEDNVIPGIANETPRRPRGRPRSPKTATPSSKAKSPTKAKKAKVVKQTKGKQKAGSSALDSRESENEWEEMMRDLILKDEELYSRIIRYEPIHFDIFVNMAGITGPCPTKMRAKLRSFLDKQAVHFYGSEPRQRGQRRRSRSKSKSRS